MVSIQVGTFKIPQAAPGVQNLLQKTVVGRQVIKQQQPVPPKPSAPTISVWHLPQIAPDILRDPLGTVIEGISHTMFGTKEQQIIGASKWIPAAIIEESRGKPQIITPPGFFERMIEKQKREQEGAAEFWGDPGHRVIPVPDVPALPEFPDIFGGLKDIGKWVLIGGAVFLGAVLLMKVGGKK